MPQLGVRVHGVPSVRQAAEEAAASSAAADAAPTACADGADIDVLASAAACDGVHAVAPVAAAFT